MPQLEIETTARRIFCERTAATRPEDYVQRPAYLLRSSGSGGAPAFGPAEGRISPFEFILRARRPYFVHYGEYEIAPPWTLFVVTGQYGMGKTVFVRILLDLVEQDPELAEKWLLVPVPLASCRSELGSKSIPASLEELVAAADIPGLSGLEPGSRRLLLILDGLDELVTELEPYRDFFRSLRVFLEQARSRGIYADVVVLARIELILSVDTPDSSVLLDSFCGDAPHPSTVFGLVLDFFDRSRVVTFLERNLPVGAAEATRLIDTDPDYMETLKRPLLLKIFCDLKIQAGLPEERLKALLSSPAALIERYVSEARRTGTLNQSMAESRTTWNLDRLAEKALELYKSNRKSLSEGDLDYIRELNEADFGEDVFHSIIKCPFLQRVGNTAIFGHRLFLEFFVAKGMADRARAAASIEEVVEFNELVLNVDMRQILRYFVNGREIGSLEAIDTRFHELTRFSYGLEPESAGEWYWPERPLGDSARRRLDRIRRVLLDAMTFPLRRDPGSHAKFLAAIRDLFAEERAPTAASSNEPFRRDLDPRYLMYCYESIATYLAYNRGRDQDCLDLESELARRVARRLKGVVEDFQRGEWPVLEAVKRFQLLLERLVLIARRLGIGRGKIEAGLVQQIGSLVAAQKWDLDSRERLRPSLDALVQLLSA